MKTLSIKNPWGILIAKGLKDVENRTWKTDYRGKILIHVSKNWDNFYSNPLNLFTSKQISTIPLELKIEIENRKLLTSSIIGEVELVDIINNSKSIWAVNNQYHWILEKPVLYTKPITNISGSLGLWDFSSKTRLYFN